MREAARSFLPLSLTGWESLGTLPDNLGERYLTRDRDVDLLQGTLDMLVLKAVSLGPLHGYGVLLRIQQISGERLKSGRRHSIRRSIDWDTRDGSPGSGAKAKTGAERGTTG